MNFTVKKFETDRDENPLMKALYDVAKEQGQTLVVVAYDKRVGSIRPFLIDCRDDTHAADAVMAFDHASAVLAKAAYEIQKFAAPRADEDEDAP